MEQQRRYEILAGLPPYGPMAVFVSDGVGNSFSEGYVVRFYRNDGTDWVANFSRGITNLDGIYEPASSQHLLVIAGGCCYMMDPEQTKPMSVFGWCYTAVLLTGDGRFVLYDWTDITVVEADGTYWYSERIALDGMEDVVLEGSIVKGLCYKHTGWDAFAYDINTRTFLDGSEAYVF